MRILETVNYGHHVCVFVIFAVQPLVKNVAGEGVDIDLGDLPIAVPDTSHAREDCVKIIRHPVSFPFVQNKAQNFRKKCHILVIHYLLLCSAYECSK